MLLNLLDSKHDLLITNGLVIIAVMLELKRYTDGEKVFFLTLMQNKAVMQHVGGVKTLERAEDLFSRYKADRMSWAVFLDGKVIGHSALVITKENTVEVVVYIDPNYSGQSLGAKVCELLIVRAKERKIKNIQAGVDIDNLACISMLKKAGFTNFEKLKDEEGYYYLFTY